MLSNKKVGEKFKMDYFNYENELYHYGVKGMKWGVRRSNTKSSSSGGSTAKKIGHKVGEAVSKRVQKKREKAEARQKSYNRTTDMFGVGGAALRSYAEYQGKKRLKGMAVHVINGSANAFISSNTGSYRVNRGVDFARRTAINGLSLSANIDQIQAYATVARSYTHQVSKSRT